MQKNSTNRLVKPAYQNAHRLDRLAKPYLIWLYIFAVLPMIIMIFLMFVDTEGIRFDGMSFSI